MIDVDVDPRRAKYLIITGVLGTVGGFGLVAFVVEIMSFYGWARMLHVEEWTLPPELIVGVVVGILSSRLGIRSGCLVSLVAFLSLAGRGFFIEPILGQTPT